MRLGSFPSDPSSDPSSGLTQSFCFPLNLRPWGMFSTRPMHKAPIAQWLGVATSMDPHPVTSLSSPWVPRTTTVCR